MVNAREPSGSLSSFFFFFHLCPYSLAVPLPPKVRKLLTRARLQGIRLRASDLDAPSLPSSFISLPLRPSPPLSPKVDVRKNRVRRDAADDRLRSCTEVRRADFCRSNPPPCRPDAPYVLAIGKLHSRGAVSKLNVTVLCACVARW